MCDRVKTIYEYYTNIEYNEIEKEKVLMEISNLCKNVQFNVDDDLVKRSLEVTTMIKKNLRLFQSFEYVDVIATIIEYLDYLRMKFMLGNIDDCDETDEVISILYTIFSICSENEVRSFLCDTILSNSKLEKFLHLISELNPNEFHEMIVLADSDLYAVISYLKMTKNLHYDKIWIQLPIKQKFLSLMKEYCAHLECSIHVFHSKQELLTPIMSNKINILSIWSEDVITAKNLATSLKRNVLFINAHMDLYGGIAPLPYIRKMYDCLKLDKDERAYTTAELSESENTVYSLFYDGMWQKPVKNTYWKCNDKLWANATSEDIKRCIGSAQKGYKNWSIWSINSRIEVLSKLAFTLQCNGKFILADVVLKWIRFPYYYENSILYPQNGRLQITTIHKPRGFIILKAEQETVLFRQLMQALICGNSVIVICNATCTLAPYCDMFSTSGIPSGVINMLSRENTEDILDKSLFNNYENRLFIENDLKRTYKNLTTFMKIIHPIK